MIQLNVQDGSFLFPGEHRVLVRCYHLQELHWRAQRLETEFLSSYRGGREPEQWRCQVRQLVEHGQELTLDLEPVLRGEPGYVALQLGDGKVWSQRLWLDLTGVAVTQFRTISRLALWAVDLRLGFPVSELRWLDYDGDSGEYLPKTIALPIAHSGRQVDVVVAEPPGNYSTRGSWYTCLDRRRYQAGDTVALGGWLRTQRDPCGPLVQPGCQFLEYSSKMLGSGRCPLSPLGGFQLRLAFPPDCPTGHHEFTLRGRGADGERFLLNVLFRTEVPERSEPSDYSFFVEPGPGPWEYTACARLRTGQNVIDTINWELELRPLEPRPARDHGFSFGPASDSGGKPALPKPAVRTLSVQGRTDRSGRHTVKLTNVAGAAFAGRLKAVLGSPMYQRHIAEQRFQTGGCSLWVGLRGQGEEIEVIVCDSEGTMQAGHEVHISPGFQTVVSEDRPVRLSLGPMEGWVSARVRDAAGLGAVTVLAWPSTPPELPSPHQEPAAESRFWAENPVYRLGDTVRLWLQLPEPGGVGLLQTFQRKLRVLLQQPISQALTLWEFPVDTAMLGGVCLRLDVLSDRGHESFQLTLEVPFEEKRLHVELQPLGGVLQAGQPAEVRVRVHQATGRPAPGAEVLLLVLEEDAERLQGSAMRDPLTNFYERRSPFVTAKSTADQRPHSRLPPLPQPPQSPQPERRVSRHEHRFAPPEQPRAFLRPSRQPLACWTRLECDEQGEAIARFLLPSQGTVHQVRAVAAWRGDCFGQGNARIETGSGAVSLRALTPAFVRPGDELTVRVELDKTGGPPLLVQVYARVQGGEVLGSGGWSVLLDQPVHLDLKIRVAETHSLTLQLEAHSPSGQDSLERVLSVRPLPPLRNVICTGTLDDVVRLRQGVPGPLRLSFSSEDPWAGRGTLTVD